jgi:hypothetical protein
MKESMILYPIPRARVTKRLTKRLMSYESEILSWGSADRLIDGTNLAGLFDLEKGL